jgi:hypothetical protein
MTREELRKKLDQFFLIVGPVPNPITPEWLTLAVSAGMLAKDNLKNNTYYYGHCRHTNVACWNETEKVFNYVRHKFDYKFIDQIEHPESDRGFDLFIPIAEVEPTNEERVF